MTTININPMATTTAAGLFNTSSTGFVQGDAQDDPATKFALVGGQYQAAATAPLWGGLPIQELIPTAAQSTFGNQIALSTSLATISGFAVNNQAYQGITTPQSPSPLILPGMSVNYYRLKSGARIPLPILASLTSLDGGQTNQQVSWDWTLNQITTYDGTNALPLTILEISATGNLLVSYNSGTGYATWTTTGAIALCQI